MDSKTSTLVAVNCGHTQMLRVVDMYDMDRIRQAMDEERSLEVLVYMPEFNENRIVRIDNLHLAKDGWGVEHIEGAIMEDGGIVQAILYDNEAEANPLNLR